MIDMHMEESASAFAQISVFAEELNLLCWRQVIAGRLGSVQLQSPLLELRKRITSYGHKRFLGLSDFFVILKAAGLEPSFDPALVDEVCKMMLEPAQMSPTQNGDIALKGTPHLRAVQEPAQMYGRVRLQVGDGDLDDISYESDNTGRIIQWPEALDPTATIEMFLVKSRGVRPHDAAAFVQAWLRSTFSLVQSLSLRKSLLNVCGRLNELFWGTPGLSGADVTASSPVVVASRVVCEEIFSLLTDQDEMTRRRQAVGIWLLLRHAGFLDGHYVDVVRNRQDGLPSGSGARRGFNCLRALQAIGYTHLLTRLFGSALGVKGLGDILFGGLLIHGSRGSSLVLKGRAGSAKTLFALTIASDIARKGDLCLYLSMEESYSALVERLVTFQLLGDYDIVALNATDSLPELPKGGLIFYDHCEGDELPVIEMIEELVQASRGRLRGVIIDSVNALSDGDFSRSSFVPLVECVERSGLLGVLVAEATDGGVSISYLADTVIHLGSDETKQHRWLEVEKCRAQDYLAGQHLFKIEDMAGIKCCSNLAGVRNSLRRRRQQPPSDRRGIEGPLWLLGKEVPLWLPEKSSTTILGAPGSGKTTLALQLLIAESKQRSRDGAIARSRTPRHGLVISFSVPQVRFIKMVRSNPELFAGWRGISRVGFKWVPPGDEISLEEIVGDLSLYIRESKRYGLPLERIIFYHAETAGDHSAPVSSKAYFWSTLFELLRTEGITSFFVINVGRRDDQSETAIEAESDFSILVSREEGLDRSQARLLKPWEPSGNSKGEQPDPD